MAGKAKFAERMGSHIGQPVEAACPITRPGGSVAQIGMATGGLVGAAIASRGGKDTGDLEIGQFAWLGLTTTQLVITKANFMGKPTGDPLATVGYAEVAEASVTDGKITKRVDLALHDGRHIAFEIKTQGGNKPSVEVVDLLRSRIA